MTPEQAQHLESLGIKFFDQVSKKYEAGAKEHGGNLWDMSTLELLHNLRDEAIDAYVYCQTAIDKLEADIISKP